MIPKLILQSLIDSNYLASKCVSQNGKIRFQFSLLKNGLKLREQLLKKWIDMSNNWTTQYGNIQKIEQNVKPDNQPLFLQYNEFQKAYEHICKEKIVNLSNAITLKTIFKNANNFMSEENIFCDTEANTLLVTDIFVAAEVELSKYYNLQRERKIWWMRFSANPSRYWVEPFDLCLKGNAHNEINKKSKSIIIKANFPFGLVDIESIYLVPLYQFDSSNLPFNENSYKVSLIRSVINLDLTASALILDATLGRTKNKYDTLMLNGKLAPYQVLLAKMHQGDKAVDELALHVHHVISKSGLRLYDTSINIKNQMELENKLIQFDSLGVPYTLIFDNESIKSGLIKLRCRDTTLFETIHISDVPNYLLNIFKQ